MHPGQHQMSLLAHTGSGLINTWGFAYVGGVISLVTAALYYVHRTIAHRASSPRSASRSYPFRAIVPLGFVCGVSIGLGSGRLLESAIDTAPNTAELVQEICAAAATDQPGAFDAIHDDIEHYAADRSDNAVTQAHTNLDNAIANNPERLPTEIMRLLATLDTADSSAAAPTCPTLSSRPQQGARNV